MIHVSWIVVRARLRCAFYLTGPLQLNSDAITYWKLFRNDNIAFDAVHEYNNNTEKSHMIEKCNNNSQSTNIDEQTSEICI